MWRVVVIGAVRDRPLDYLTRPFHPVSWQLRAVSSNHPTVRLGALWYTGPLEEGAGRLIDVWVFGLTVVPSANAHGPTWGSGAAEKGWRWWWSSKLEEVC